MLTEENSQGKLYISFSWNSFANIADKSLRRREYFICTTTVWSDSRVRYENLDETRVTQKNTCEISHVIYRVYRDEKFCQSHRNRKFRARTESYKAWHTCRTRDRAWSRYSNDAAHRLRWEDRRSPRFAPPRAVARPCWPRNTWSRENVQTHTRAWHGVQTYREALREER